MVIPGANNCFVVCFFVVSMSAFSHSSLAAIARDWFHTGLVEADSLGVPDVQQLRAKRLERLVRHHRSEAR